MINTNIWRFFIANFIILLFTTNAIYSQNSICNWLTQELNPESYEINNDYITLFYCAEYIDVLSVPMQYNNPTLTTSSYNGVTCQDIAPNIDENGSQYFTINFEDDCIQQLDNNILTVTFEGFLSDGSSETCTFDIYFHQLGDPFISVEDFNTKDQLVICEQDLITLTADGLGTGIDLLEFTWYLNGEVIENQSGIELDVMSTDYDVNQSNTFYFTANNYCTNILNQNIESDWLTITIYEGYDNCDPCKWEPFTRWNEDQSNNNEFCGFCIECDGDGYFPELPNNETNRSFTNETNHPTCEATTYRITIFNRLGREVFQSSYDNHPWNGKLENGKKCKEGTYFYQMEYILHPLLEEDNQNETKISTGSVYLSWGNQ